MCVEGVLEPLVHLACVAVAPGGGFEVAFPATASAVDTQ